MEFNSAFTLIDQASLLSLQNKTDLPVAPSRQKQYQINYPLANQDVHFHSYFLNENKCEENKYLNLEGTDFGDFSNLPLELLDYLFSFFELKDISLLSRLNTSWRWLLIEEKIREQFVCLRKTIFHLANQEMIKQNHSNIHKELINLYQSIDKENYLKKEKLTLKPFVIFLKKIRSVLIKILGNIDIYALAAINMEKIQLPWTFDNMLNTAALLILENSCKTNRDAVLDNPSYHEFFYKMYLCGLQLRHLLDKNQCHKFHAHLAKILFCKNETKFLNDESMFHKNVLSVLQQEIDTDHEKAIKWILNDIENRSGLDFIAYSTPYFHSDAQSDICLALIILKEYEWVNELYFDQPEKGIQKNKVPKRFLFNIIDTSEDYESLNVYAMCKILEKRNESQLLHDLRQGLAVFPKDFWAARARGSHIT